MIRALRIAAAVLLLVPAVGAAADGPEDKRPPMLRGVSIDQRLGQTLPLDAIVTDESGRPGRLGDYFGKRPAVFVLAYYNCPMLCTQVFNGLVSALKVLPFDAGTQYDVVAVSFDPRDRPADAEAKKEAYVREYGRPGAASGWHFLTAGTAAIERITSAAGFRYRFDTDTGQFAHGSAVYVVTASGMLSRYFYGIEYAPRDLRLALVEASNGRVGSVVDQLLLFCYRYDPKHGRYSAAIIGAVRIGGAATVIIMSTFLAVMWRREKKRGSQLSAVGSRLPSPRPLPAVSEAGTLRSPHPSGGEGKA